MKVPDFLTLKFSAEIAADSVDNLPTEFRVFKAGDNESSKGTVVFDDAAAAAVMSAYRQWGVDLMIDLEHDSLSNECRTARSDAADALGWFGLEVRVGELWAVNVRWNDGGRERLLSKRQRYISPAFQVDEDSRVVEVLNVALVSMPATFGAIPLVAASRATNPADASSVLQVRSKMDPEQVKAALDALESGDAAKALELLKAMIATAASGEAAPASPESTEALAECAEPEPKSEDQKMLSRFAGALEKASTEIVRLSKIVETFETERAASEAIERAGLVGELVKLGVELPATAWADPAKRMPVARLQSEPIAELRSRVETYHASGTFTRREIEAPTVTLSRGEEEQAAKMTPDQRKRYEALRASRKAR